MKNLRPDLLELGPEALIALSNAGFVKKAHKELAEGKQPELSALDNGDLQARYGDGQTATLPAGASLRDAHCTCPASGLCRHRVTLVLAYQQLVAAETAAPEASPSSAPSDGETLEAPAPATTAWSPGEFVTELAGLPERIRQRCQQLAMAETVIRLLAWSASNPVPTAHLPMCSVRFFSRQSLVHARCDCTQGTVCEHIALAVLAFAHAPAGELAERGHCTTVVRAGHLASGEHAASQPTTARFDEPAVLALGQTLAQLALRLWLDGASQPTALLAPLFTQARQKACDLAFRWVDENLTELQQALKDLAARSTRASPSLLLHRLCSLLARWQAAAHADAEAASGKVPKRPMADILGQGAHGEIALDQLKLVPLGMRFADDEYESAAQLIYADPDTLALMVLERSWPRRESDETALLNRRVAGHSVRQLAGSQIVTRAAKRHANGALTLGSGSRHTNLLPLGSKAWETLSHPLRHDSAGSLVDWLSKADPDFVRPPQLVEHCHVLPVAEIIEWAWDAAAQSLHAILQCTTGEDDLCHLHLPHQPHADAAVDLLAAALGGRFGALSAIAGLCRLQGGQLHVDVLAVACAERTLVLGAESAERMQLPDDAAFPAPPARHEALEQCLALLANWLNQGLHHQGHSARQRATALCRQLEDSGFPLAARHLHQALDLLTAADQGSLPRVLCGLFWLLEECRK